MKKEMKIVLPFYKIAYAVSFVGLLSVIRAGVFTYEIGLSIERTLMCRKLQARDQKSIGCIQ